jgi:hypothetical protein
MSGGRVGGWLRAFCFGEAEPLVEALERGWRPPFPAAEQGHQGWDQQGPDDEGVDEDGGGDARADFFEEHELGGDEHSDGHGEQDRCGGDQPAGSLHPRSDGLAF